MFDLPDAKRIRRSDLYSSPSSSRADSPVQDTGYDAEAEVRLHAHFSALYSGSYDIAAPSAATIAQSSTLNVEEVITSQRNGEHQVNPTMPGSNIDMDRADVPIKSSATTIEPLQQNYEFRLFAKHVAEEKQGEDGQSEHQKVILEADTQEDVNILGEEIIRGEGGFLSKQKDPRVWTVAKAKGARLEDLRSTALSGEEVLLESTRRNWGLEVVWRVTVIKQQPIDSTEFKRRISSASGDSKKRKPGKKRRIILRDRIRQAKEEKLRKEKEDREKEENDKERRTRKNREKKVRQKMRAKAKAGILKGGESGAANAQPDEVVATASVEG